jgi:hypothetical protein
METQVFIQYGALTYTLERAQQEMTLAFLQGRTRKGETLQQKINEAISK